MIIKVSLTIYYYILFFEVLFYDSKNLDKGERIVLSGQNSDGEMLLLVTTEVNIDADKIALF